MFRGDVRDPTGAGRLSVREVQFLGQGGGGGEGRGRRHPALPTALLRRPLCHHVTTTVT